MKITEHKRDNKLSIQLTKKETFWLKTILQRYNNGQGSMAIPSNGFPMELEAALTKVVTK